MNSLNILAGVACVALFVSQSAALPGPPGNLKYTFGSKDEIPAAFFDTNPVSPKSGDKTAPEPRAAYPACQDGSGGLCVDSGKCPADLKPDSKPGACADNKECFNGVPTSDNSCKSRGGECVERSSCGRAPTFSGAVDCDKKKDEVCCIWV